VTPRTPSAVCLLFIALNINKEKDNANGLLSFITEVQIRTSYMAVLYCLEAEQGVEGGEVLVYFLTLNFLLLEYRSVME